MRVLWCAQRGICRKQFSASICTKCPDYRILFVGVLTCESNLETHLDPRYAMPNERLNLQRGDRPRRPPDVLSTMRR